MLDENQNVDRKHADIIIMNYLVAYLDDNNTQEQSNIEKHVLKSELDSAKYEENHEIGYTCEPL